MTETEKKESVLRDIFRGAGTQAEICARYNVNINDLRKWIAEYKKETGGHFRYFNRNSAKKDEIVAALTSGKYTRAEISETYGVSTSTLRNWVAEARMLDESLPKHLNYNSAMRKKAIKDYRNGLSINEICQKYKLKYSLVYYWVKRETSVV